VKTVYLCGGINGLSDADARDWREAAKAGLGRPNLFGMFAVIDPMARDYRGREAGAEHEIVAGDLADIAAADVLLVNACRPSWGTAMEIRHAFTIGKKVVVFGAGPRPSPWLVYHATEVVPDLADAVGYLILSHPDFAEVAEGRPTATEPVQ
jgi:hypothetical protein